MSQYTRAYNDTQWRLQCERAQACRNEAVRQYNKPSFATIVIDGLFFLLLGAAASWIVPQLLAILFR